jgi:hypothetical protein
MADQDASKPRWYYPTPDKLVRGLLVVQVCLLLVNADSGRMVLTAVAVTCLTILGGLAWFAVSVFLHRKFQFGISTLLLLTCAVAVSCSWFTCRMQKAKRQKEVVAEIVRWRGAVGYDYQFDPLGNMMFVRPPGPEWLRNLVGIDFLANVVYVHYYGPRITDAATTDLPKLTDLRWIRFSLTQVSDKRCRELQKALPDCEIFLANRAGPPC